MSSKMIEVGKYNNLKVIREVDFGVYLEDGAEGILLPKRFVPANTKTGDELKVFLYHDGEDRLIATTQNPKGILDDIVKLRVVSVTPQGAFLDNGLMKDLFVPLSKQQHKMIPNGEYLVKIYLDEQTGRLAATEKIESYLSNEPLTVKELEIVDLLVYRRTDIGYVVIINNKHTGVLHH
ncbi:MAG TPA: S1-like domain-containing RNA-binding protein, partial [Ferruginibacter sp.]|nr:S1-like domain-containing RNA-binding protein [Ferruginibacter sp.]